MELIEGKIRHLTNILNNFKKSPSRKYTKNFLLKKGGEIKSIYLAAIEDVEELPENEQKFVLKAIRALYSEIKTCIDSKLDGFASHLTFKTVAKTIIFWQQILKKAKNNLETRKMTTVLEIIKTASTLIPAYDGSAEKLDATLAAINALKTIITEDNKTAAINVILSKLSDKARAAVGVNINNVDEIVQKLQEKCTPRQQPETVLAKLNAVKQIGELDQFTNQVEKLSLELEKSYIALNIPVEVAAKMASKSGIKALANGIRCQETRTILKAGQFDNLNSAIGRATENYAENATNILHYKIYRNPQEVHRGEKANFQRNSYGRNNNNHFFQQRPANRGNYSHRGGFNTRNTYNQNYNYGTPNNYQNHNNGSNNSRGNTNRGRHNQPQQRIFYNQSENLLAPQHQDVGGQQQNLQELQQQHANQIQADLPINQMINHH